MEQRNECNAMGSGNGDSSSDKNETLRPRKSVKSSGAVIAVRCVVGLCVVTARRRPTRLRSVSRGPR